MPGELAHGSTRVLEFDALRELLRGYASSPLGQERIDGLTPSTDRGWIESQQKLAAEERDHLRADIVREKLKNFPKPNKNKLPGGHAEGPASETQ